MALEELLDAKKVERKPILLFFYTILCATLGIFLSYYIFPDYASVVMITFTIIPLIPIIVKLFEVEEVKLEHFNPFSKNSFSKDRSQGKSGAEGITLNIFHLFQKYLKLIRIYWYLFLALVITFSFWYTFLPDEASQRLFSAQVDTLYEFDSANAIYSRHLLADDFCDTNVLLSFQSTVTDCRVVDLNKDKYHEYIIFENSTKPTKVYYVKTASYSSYSGYVRNAVFWNNFKLMIFILLTSFILGAGALFTISWNASVVGVFIGEFMHRIIGWFGLIPFVKIPAYFVALPVSLFSIAFHGFFEFVAYFVAALSGGMIGICMIRHKFKDKQFMVILLESIMLFVIAVVLLFFSAIIESLI